MSVIVSVPVIKIALIPLVLLCALVKLVMSFRMMIGHVLVSLYSTANSMYNDSIPIISTDIDECRMAALNNSVICTNDMQCTNTLGSFKCDCVSGYELVDGNCERKSHLYTCFHSASLH